LDINEVSHEFYKQQMNLVNQKKSDTIMENKDQITNDSNSKNKKGRSKRLYDPTDESNSEIME
jgi:hypothetical protein